MVIPPTDVQKCCAEIHALQGQQFVVATAALALVGLHLNFAFDQIKIDVSKAAIAKDAAWVVVFSSSALTCILVIFGWWLLHIRRTALAISTWLQLTGNSRWESDATAFTKVEQATAAQYMPEGSTLRTGGYNLSTTAGVAKVAFALGGVLPVVAAFLVLKLKQWNWHDALIQCIILAVVWSTYLCFVYRRAYKNNVRRPSREEVDALWKAVFAKSSLPQVEDAASPDAATKN